MNTYAVTFGMKYYEGSSDVHSVFPAIRHNNYMVFEAESEEDARMEVYQLLGTDWAFIYPLDDSFFDQIRKYDLVEFDPEALEVQ